MQQLKKNFLFILYAFLALQCSNSADAWLEQAKERLKKGEFISARESIEKAIEKNPGYAEAYNLRGVIHFQEKKLVEAEQDYAKAVE